MKNCIVYCSLVHLRNFILGLGILELCEILGHFDVCTGIMLMDKEYQKTKDISKTRYAIMQTEVGYWTKRSGKELIAQLIRVLTTPTCPEEAVRVNTALKVLYEKKCWSRWEVLHLNE